MKNSTLESVLVGVGDGLPDREATHDSMRSNTATSLSKGAEEEE